MPGDDRRPRVGLVLDPVFERHDTGAGHPERPARVEAIRTRLAAAGLEARCIPWPVEEIESEALLAVHPAEYVRRIERRCAEGPGWLDTEDTYAGPATPRVARLAAGSVTALARAVARNELDRGFAVVRPPGHHAERSIAMGFCLYNNVAIAARALQKEPSIERVLVVDWDVHHGNGTQHLFEDDPTVFYFSVHQSPLYPGTGAASERGRGAGEGFTRNVPLPPGAGDREYLEALTGPLVEEADRFRPDFVLVSAGFDPHRADPLAGLDVSTEGFAEATRAVLGVAERHCHGRFVSLLEGGYDLDALAASCEAHLGVLLGV